MKNAYDGLIRRLTMAKERLSELEEMSWETSKSEKQIEQEIKIILSHYVYLNYFYSLWMIRVPTIKISLR